MKTTIAILTALILTALILTACQKPQSGTMQPEPTENPAQPIVGATPQPVMSPVPVSTPTFATPNPDTLPVGVYVTRIALRYETADSLSNINPGTLATELRPGVFLVQGFEMNLTTNQITHSKSEARAIIAQQQSIRISPPQAIATPTIVTQSVPDATPIPHKVNQIDAPPAEVHFKMKGKTTYQR